MGNRDVSIDGRLIRTRWAAIGAAVAVSMGGGGLLIADAANGSSSSVVTVDPLRIMDTRDPVNVGLSGPFVSAVSQKLQVTGAVQTTTGIKTAVPTGATGVMLNVTVTGPTASGFVSIRPGDATGAPTTSSLNVSAGGTTPNAVTVALPTSGPNAGKIEITFDAYGTVGPTAEILIDVVGFTTDLIPSGQTVTGFGTFDHAVIADDATFLVAVQFPQGRAPIALGDIDVNFAPFAGVVDGDATCTGSAAAPTAPAGKVCLYVGAVLRVDGLIGYSGPLGFESRGFRVSGSSNGALGEDMFVGFAWAYTAP